MWTPATRGRMATIEKKTKRYPSDLTDEEWARIEPFLPRASKAGRPIEVDLREVLNAIRYMARSGGGWRMLPNDFPPWQTVYRWFRRFVRRFLFQTIHDVALMLDRERVGREASPTGGVVDSQSVKAPEAKTRGYDAGKKIVGRKRHIAVDTDGRLLVLASDKPLCGVIYRKKIDLPPSVSPAWGWFGETNCGPNGSIPADENGFLKFKRIPTGFMKIGREVFERLIEAHPDWKCSDPQNTLAYM